MRAVGGQGRPPVHRVLVSGHLLYFRLQLRLGCSLSAQFGFERGELRFDFLVCLALANDLFAVAAQEVIDGLDANSDGAGGLVLVEILEAEVRSAGLLDDALDYAVDGRVVSALEAGDFERDEIRMARGELRGPDLVVGAARVRILPGVGDIE